MPDDTCAPYTLNYASHPMANADHQFFQDYADAFRQRHNYTGHRTVYLRHQTQEAVTLLHALLLSFPAKEQTPAHLCEFASTFGALRSQHLLAAPSTRDRIHGQLWSELSVDDAVLKRIFAMRRGQSGRPTGSK